LSIKQKPPPQISLLCGLFATLITGQNAERLFQRYFMSSDDRKHLTAFEVGKLLSATKGSRHEARDRCLLLLMFRHGLRVSEACTLRLDQVDVESRVLHVARLKKGLSTTHPIRADEIRIIKAWLAERARMKPNGKTFFVSQKRKQLDRRSAWLAIKKYGKLAGLALPAHPHQLRHACGFALADQGADTRLIQDYLGHRDIRHTVIYTAANPARFERLWRN
jgi:type 1 fimbriae regulatory protein FimB